MSAASFHLVVENGDIWQTIHLTHKPKWQKHEIGPRIEIAKGRFLNQILNPLIMLKQKLIGEDTLINK